MNVPRLRRLAGLHRAGAPTDAELAVGWCVAALAWAAAWAGAVWLT